MLPLIRFLFLLKVGVGSAEYFVRGRASPAEYANCPRPYQRRRCTRKEMQCRVLDIYAGQLLSMGSLSCKSSRVLHTALTFLHEEFLKVPSAVRQDDIISFHDLVYIVFMPYR